MAETNSFVEDFGRWLRRVVDTGDAISRHDRALRSVGRGGFWHDSPH